MQKIIIRVKQGLPGGTEMFKIFEETKFIHLITKYINIKRIYLFSCSLTWKNEFEVLVRKFHDFFEIYKELWFYTINWQSYMKFIVFVIHMKIISMSKCIIILGTMHKINKICYTEMTLWVGRTTCPTNLLL